MTQHLAIMQGMTTDEALLWKAKVGGTANELRLLLHEGYERGAWEALGYANWTECLQSLAEEYGFTERRLWQLHAANQTGKLLNNCSVGEIREGVLRPLTRLAPELQPVAWQEAVATAPNGKPTAAHVADVARRYIAPEPPDSDDDTGEWVWAYDPEDGPAYCKYCYESHQSWETSGDHDRPVWICNRCEHATADEFMQPVTYHDQTPDAGQQNDKPHVSHNSGNNEWYTPAEYIEAARRVLGEIDLDPASSDKANAVVRATRYYTAEDNGLEQEWYGRVWMNPPYAGELIGKFADKMAAAYEWGDVEEAIVLVNNATETIWFRRLISVASAVAFPASRIRFWRPDGTTGEPLQGQAIIYLGESPQTFKSAFMNFGWIASL